MRHVMFRLCICAAAAASGCTASPLAEHWRERRPLGRDLQTYRPPRTPRTAREQPVELKRLAGEPLDLRRALAAALVRNPDLAAFGWEVRAREAHALQQGLYPNPRGEVEVEGIGQRSDFDIGETTIRLAQPILTAGKLEKRTRVAELRRDLAGWDYEAKRLDVLTQVVQRFVDVLAARHHLEESRRVHELAEQMLQIVTRQVEAGEVSSIEQARARVQLSRNRIEARRAERALKSARLALAQTLGLAEPTFEEVVGDLEAVQPVPPLEALEALVSQNPAIARWETVLTERRAEIDLAEARAWPNVTAGAGVKRLGATEELAPVLSLSLPLPIFDRNQGDILEARYELAQAAQQRRAAVIRVRSTLGQRYQDLQAAREAATILAEQTLPGARSAFQAVRAAHRQGERGFLDVLIAQRTLIEVEDQYVHALAEYHTAAAQVERLVAQSLQEIQPAIKAEPQLEAAPGPPIKQETQPSVEGNTQ